ncbi:MAG: response regulator [Gammaproteobacteria bacterium]
MELSKILYVEDEEDICSIAQIALEDLGGFTVKFCHSGTDALRDALAFGPDLILLDVMMPDMDGPTTLTELQKISGLENVPIIFMTAKIQTNEVNEFRSMKNVIDVVAKPFDPMTLAETLRNSWNKHSG